MFMPTVKRFDRCRIMRVDEGKLPRLMSVKTLGAHSIALRFEGGQAFTVDLREFVHSSRGLKKLRDAEVFAQVGLGEGGHSIEWPGELDVGADTLWELALRQNGHADAAEFIRWRWKHALSLTAAAEALGMSRRQIAYYSSGEHEVPRHILLACKGWEVEQAAA
jgi:hypothetical protein